MTGVLLAINVRNTVRPAKRDQSRQGDFGGVCLVREHRFTEHRFANADAIQPTDQLAVDPGFNTVGKTRPIQGEVRLNHGRQNPGSARAAAAVGAGANHLFKRGVDPDIGVRCPGEFLNGFAQGRVQAELARLQHHAGVRAPPQNRLAFTEPRKNALAVRLAKAPDVQ